MKHETHVITVRAPVDRLIVPLVRSLMIYPEVSTLYSCQGTKLDPEKQKPWSWDKDASYVIFMVGGGSSIENAVFLDFLAEHMNELSIYVQLEMPVVGGAPQVELRMKQEDLAGGVKWLHSIRKHWRGLNTELKKKLSKFRIRQRQY